MRSSDQQWVDLIQKSKSILIAVTDASNADALASASCIQSLLEEKGKDVTLITPHEVEQRLQFLPHTSTAKQKIQIKREYVCTIQTPGTTIEDVQYEKSGNKLNIFLTPQEGEIDHSNVTVTKGPFKKDLIITVGCQDLEQLNELYEQNSELFYETPILNIDNNPSNEYFGTINVVDITACSSAEILYHFIKQHYDEVLNTNTATSLLTGIIAATESFQSQTTTPNALTAAAHLIEIGAKQQEIVQHLYKTQSLQTLKLWGRVMARLEHDEALNATWSLMTQNDFEKTGTSQEKAAEMIRELEKYAPQSSATFLLYENSERTINGILHAKKHFDTQTLKQRLEGTVNAQHIEFQLSTNNILDAEKEVLQILKQARHGKGQQQQQTTTPQRAQQHTTTAKQPSTSPRDNNQAPPPNLPTAADTALQPPTPPSPTSN